MSAEAFGLLGAVLAGFVALLLHGFQERSKRSAELRQSFAAALSDVLMWLELPYRVRRRERDGRAALVKLTHGLQERLLHHQTWLMVESQDVHDAYSQLLIAAKRQTGPLIKAAWETPPVDSDAGMNIGEMSAIDVSNEIEVYLERVRSYLAGYGYKFWR